MKEAKLKFLVLVSSLIAAYSAVFRIIPANSHASLQRTELRVEYAVLSASVRLFRSPWKSKPEDSALYSLAFLAIGVEFRVSSYGRPQNA